MNWYLGVLKKYAVFNGRASRREYWMFQLFNFIFAALAVFLDNLLGTADEDVGYGIIYALYVLAVLLPSLAVAVRRLHDTGRSGWWLLISLLPLVGGVVLFVFMVTDSQPGANQYGPNPKGEQHYVAARPGAGTDYREGDLVKCGACGRPLRVKYHDAGRMALVTAEALQGVALRCQTCGFIVCDPCSMPPGGTGIPTCPRCRATTRGPYFFLHS